MPLGVRVQNGERSKCSVIGKEGRRQAEKQADQQDQRQTNENQVAIGRFDGWYCAKGGVQRKCRQHAARRT